MHYHSVDRVHTIFSMLIVRPFWRDECRAEGHQPQPQLALWGGRLRGLPDEPCCLPRMRQESGKTRLRLASQKLPGLACWLGRLSCMIRCVAIFSQRERPIALVYRRTDHTGIAALFPEHYRFEGKQITTGDELQIAGVGRIGCRVLAATLIVQYLE
jgi:hypothetical protein